MPKYITKTTLSAEADAEAPDMEEAQDVETYNEV